MKNNLLFVHSVVIGKSHQKIAIGSWCILMLVILVLISNLKSPKILPHKLLTLQSLKSVWSYSGASFFLHCPVLDNTPDWDSLGCWTTGTFCCHKPSAASCRVLLQALIVVFLSAWTSLTVLTRTKILALSYLFFGNRGDGCSGKSQSNLQFSG